jgi:hypothetical protein
MASRATVIQSLSIALIVFVMLTFVLAVTTYLFFTQKIAAEKEMRDAATEMAAAKGDREKTEADADKLRQLLGFPEGKPIDEIETAIGEAFERDFGDSPEDAKGYVKLADWLLSAVKSKDEAIKALTLDKMNLEKEKEEAIAEATTKQEELKKQVEAQKKATEEIERKFGEDRGKHEQFSKALGEQQSAALKKAERLKLLEDEIAKGEAVLPADMSARFKAQPAEGRIGMFFKELREREKTIARQDELLATLRVADPALQKMVLDATPKDDRIDGFDGRILSVNEIDRTVLIDFGSTRGLRTGLVLKVYEPGDERPQYGSYKAVVEVFVVESGALARARIRQESTRNPILAGDRVATSLWSPGGTFEAVIVGFVQLDDDAKPDQDRLRESIERVGGRVEQSVSAATRMLVDAGSPRTVGTESERTAGWRPADDQRREKQLKEAGRLGIPVVGLEAFMEMLGIDRDAFDSNRLALPGIR